MEWVRPSNPARAMSPDLAALAESCKQLGVECVHGAAPALPIRCRSGHETAVTGIGVRQSPRSTFGERDRRDQCLLDPRKQRRAHFAECDRERDRVGVIALPRMRSHRPSHRRDRFDARARSRSVIAMATYERSAVAGADDRNATRSAVSPPRRDDCIARTMRKPDRTKLPAVVALLLIGHPSCCLDRRRGRAYLPLALVGGPIKDQPLPAVVRCREAATGRSPG